MTQIGPGGIIRSDNIRAVPSIKSPSNERFELKIHEVSPENIAPNGDRYVVEVIDLDENIQLGQILIVSQDPNINPRDPSANPTIEQRGVLAAVVIRGGNGHLLGLPDTATATTSDRIVRTAADVPMFFEAGDVVLVDRNAKGRALKIVGRECRIVNQIDVLAKIDGVRLVRDDNAWVREAE